MSKLGVVTREVSQNVTEKYAAKSIRTFDGRIKSFDEIKISTKTVIGVSNLKIDLDKFFKFMPITDYTVVEKKRGRKRRIQIPTMANNVPFGSIISLQKRKDIRGACLKSKTKNFFLHSVTVVIILENSKQINVKVSQNGKFQITGCKCDDHFIQAITTIYDIMKVTEEWIGEKIFTIEGEKLQVVFTTVMQNMDFNIGFEIIRDKLDTFINKHTKYRSIFEGSISAGVSIKINVDEDDTADNLLRITYLHDSGNVVKDFVPQSVFDNLLNSQTEEETTGSGDQPSGKKKVVKKKKKYHTFLVFSTGSIIMSSKGKNMEKIFNDIVNILLQNREHFEKVKVQRKIGKDLVSEKYPQLANNHYRGLVESWHGNDVDFLSYKDWHIEEYPEEDIVYTSEKFKYYKLFLHFRETDNLDELVHEYNLEQLQNDLDEEVEDDSEEVNFSDFSD